MKIFVVGDSHSRFFELTGELKTRNEKYKGLDFEVHVIPGASIKGFGKRKSTLNTNIEVRNRVEKINPDYVVMCLGQVDIELGYYYQKCIKKLDVDFESYANSLIESYVEEVKSLGVKTILKGVNQTVLTGYREKAIKYVGKIIAENISDAEEVRLARKRLSEMFPSVLERVSNHFTFNEKLKIEAKRNDFLYFDINEMICESDGLVCDKYIPASFDHHLVDSIEVREIHIDNLLKTIFNR
ncbi:hypothetical protein L4D06_01170 [Enterovibrio makurazakiensis]|uniref:hypothetical protein n=1 Tax=Enterovibrio makurazakiensis TaxID=2910232 RepID=UPI003D1A1AA7